MGKITEEEKLEYTKAQDSAEHYNTIMWTLINIGLGLSLLILYTATTGNSDYILKQPMLIFGLAILAYFSLIIHKSNINKLLKYDICKKIENKHPKKFIGQNNKIASGIIPYLILGIGKIFIFSIYFSSIKEIIVKNIILGLITIETAYILDYFLEELKL